MFRLREKLEDPEAGREVRKEAGMDMEKEVGTEGGEETAAAEKEVEKDRVGEGATETGCREV